MTAESGLSAPTLHIAYMAVCIVMLTIIYTVPLFDLRSLRRMARRRADPEGSGSVTSPLLDQIDRPDLGAVLNLLVIAGTALAMLVGWRIPAEIERIYGAGASFGLLFPSVEMTTLGKGAQVIGVIAMGLIALRLLRILVVFAAAGLAGLGGVAAVNYVFDLNLLALL